LGATPDGPIVRQDRRVNSRAAATELVHTCRLAAPVRQNERRQAACYQKWKKHTTFEAKCNPSGGLGDDTNWAAVKAGTNNGFAAGDDPVDDVPADQAENQNDIAACIVTLRGGGVSWRNSDPMICGRVERAKEECDCTFKPVPEKFNGLDLTGWQAGGPAAGN